MHLDVAILGQMLVMIFTKPGGTDSIAMQELGMCP
jgi:hypothetical protein